MALREEGLCKPEWKLEDLLKYGMKNAEEVKTAFQSYGRNNSDQRFNSRFI